MLAYYRQERAKKKRKKDDIKDNKDTAYDEDATTRFNRKKAPCKFQSMNVKFP